MDTIEEQEPAGSDDVTSSPDTSLVDTQPSEPTDSIDGAPVAEEGATAPKFAGKYDSPEELEKAYLEAQKKISENGQKARVADLIQEKYGMTPEEFQATIEAEEQQRLEQEYRTNPAGAALREAQAVKQELALMKEERELDDFIAKNPDYAAQRDKILKLGLNLERGKSYEEIAREYFGEVRAKGQQDAYKKIDAKVRTQATGTQSAPPKKFTDSDFENMSAAEMEAILPHADTSHRPY